MEISDTVEDLEISEMVKEIESAYWGSFVDDAIKKYHSDEDIRNFYEAYVLFLKSQQENAGVRINQDTEKYAHLIIAKHLSDSKKGWVYKIAMGRWQDALPSLEPYLYCAENSDLF